MKTPVLALSFKPHPFRLLLGLEWILIGLSAFKLLSMQIFFGLPIWIQPISFSEFGLPENNPFQPMQALGFIGLLTIFTFLGFRLPIDRLSKFCYMSLSFLVIGAIGYIGVDSLPPLLTVLLLRGCLIFERRGRWMIASLVWLSYLLLTLLSIFLVWVTFQANTIKDWLRMIPGLIVRGDGSIQWTLSLSAPQLNQLTTFIQRITVYGIFELFLSSGLIIIFMLLLVDSLVNERQGRKKLAIAHQQLYQYSLQIEDQATLQERTRIAREIHDSLGHLLTAQSVMLENTTMSLNVADEVADDARSFLDESQRLGQEARRELRQAVWMLRSDPMQGKSLPQAIEDLVQRFLQVTGIHPVVHLAQTLTFPGRYQMVLYRILEEALTNVQKHSQATQVTIDLTLQTREDEIPQIVLKIIDNGTGFNPQQTRSGFGIQGMKERVASLSGTLDFEIQAGCSIIAHIPLLEVSL
jgi:signal transduction histidine kinase